MKSGSKVAVALTFEDLRRPALCVYGRRGLWKGLFFAKGSEVGHLGPKSLPPEPRAASQDTNGSRDRDSSGSGPL